MPVETEIKFRLDTLADLAGKDRPTVDECGYALGLWLGVVK